MKVTFISKLYKYIFRYINLRDIFLDPLYFLSGEEIIVLEFD